jgi:hypothetical protein
MARPGLEPGTPRFSGTAELAGNDRKSLQIGGSQISRPARRYPGVPIVVRGSRTWRPRHVLSPHSRHARCRLLLEPQSERTFGVDSAAPCRPERQRELRLTMRSHPRERRSVGRELRPGHFSSAATAHWVAVDALAVRQGGSGCSGAPSRIGPRSGAVCAGARASIHVGVPTRRSGAGAPSCRASRSVFHTCQRSVTLPLSS